MALNLNGSILFPLIHQKRALIKHYSNKPTRASRHGTFLFTTSGDWKGQVMNCLRLSTSQMFQYPCMITVTIAATTMYRSLVNVSSSER